MPSILREILSVKREEVAAEKRLRSRAQLESELATAEPTRGFTAALRRSREQPIRVIAEIKRASPSAGQIRPGADPAAIAREYQAGGAAAISVLTDQRFFDGRQPFLAAARAACGLPILRKDFVVDPYQVVQSRVLSADAVLLIVAALDGELLPELLAAAGECGLDALVEVHDEREAERALLSGATLLGVNHRDLHTFTIDLSLGPRILKRCPPGTVTVAESGIRTPSDLGAVDRAGISAVLIGEALMRAPSPGAALAALLSSIPSP